MDIGGETVGAAMVRHDGWTNERQFGFLQVLADCGSVTRAAAAVGMSASSAYRRRGRDREGLFAYGWQAAEAMAYHRLRTIALDRIDTGLETALVYRGEVVATKTVFSDRLLLGLLDHLRPPVAAKARPGTNAAAPAARPADPSDDFAAAINAYATAIDDGTDPVRPASPSDPVARPVMTREEFLERIAHARSITEPEEGGHYDSRGVWRAHDDAGHGPE